MMGKVIMSGIVPPLVAPVTGILAGDLAVGSSVYLMENSVAVEYLVVNQGIPSGSSLYDASCDGTWLLRKDVLENRKWHSTRVNKYESSDTHTYLNGDFLGLFGEVEQSVIKQVKIPYRQNGGSSGTDQSGENGLSVKIFLLSTCEIGGTTLENPYPTNSAKLEYFDKGDASAANQKRIAYLDGTANNWWLRSPNTDATMNTWRIDITGSPTSGASNVTGGIRPALIIPRNALFEETTLILKGVA